MNKQLNKVTSGNIIKVANSDKWYYVINYYCNGKRRQEKKSTGLKAIKANKKAAEAIRDQRVMELKEMFDISAKDWYLHDFVQNWYDTVAKYEVKENTYISYSTPVKHIVRYFGQKGNRILLTDCTPVHLNQYYNYLMSNNLLCANTIYSKIHMILHRVFRYACESRILQSNPADFDRPPKKTKSDKRALTKEELGRLLEEADGTVFYAPIWLASRFGLRRSEAVGLRWSSVDFEDKTMVIKDTAMQGYTERVVESTKNKSSRRILTLTDEDIMRFRKISSLQKQMMMKSGKPSGNCEFVCTDEYGERLKMDRVSRGATKLMRQVGIEKATFHCLRHSVASLLLESGMDMMDISRMLGHSTITTTIDIYGHWSDKKKKEAANIMSNIVNE